jgi:hypothetical protein
MTGFPFFVALTPKKEAPEVIMRILTPITWEAGWIPELYWGSHSSLCNDYRKLFVL